MATPPRLNPLLAQFDFARERLTDRMAGPDVDGGNGTRIDVAAMTDEEYLHHGAEIAVLRDLYRARTV